MSIFAIITDLEVLNPPALYEEFTTQFLSRPKPHITLIQPRMVTPEEGVALLASLAHDLAPWSAKLPMEDTATGLRLFEDGTGFLIGIDNKEVIALQKELRARIPTHLAFYNPEGRQYEQEFWPHLTMADMIPKGKLPALMDQYDLKNLRLGVRVHKILCTLPKDFSIEESRKEENYHVMLP